MKKQTVLSILFSAMVIPTTVAFVGCGGGPSIELQGSGTQADPYIIASAEDLNVITQADADISDLTEGKYFKLTADIGSTETPYLTSIAGFTATFKGILSGEAPAGSEASKFTITLSGPTALFGVNAGTIENLNIAGTIVTEATQTGTVGMLANTNTGIISDIAVSGSVTNERGTVSDLASAEATGVGALVGTNDTTGVIAASQNTATVKSKAGAGGIAAVNKGDINNVSNTGTIGMDRPSSNSDWLSNTTQYSVMGGVAGINYGEIKGSYNKANVFAPALNETGEGYVATMTGNQYIGGIAGYNKANATITQSINMFGKVNSINISVFGDKYVGGIAGYNDGAIEYSLSNVNLGARSNFAGIASENGTNGTVKYCVAGHNQARGALETISNDDAAASYYWFISSTAENCVYNSGSNRGAIPTGENIYVNCGTGYSNDPFSSANTPEKVEAAQEKVDGYLEILNAGCTTCQIWAVMEAQGNSNPIIQPKAFIDAQVIYTVGEGTDAVTTTKNFSSFKDGHSITLTAPEAPAGTEFKGWSTTTLADNIVYDETETTTPETTFDLVSGQTLTLYAIFAAIPVE